LRGVALLIVVAGHLTLAVIDRQGGEVRGENLLALFPRWYWVTIIAPMPLFFLAGGYANSESSFTESTRRLSLFAGLATIVVSVWALPVVITQVLAGSTGIVGDGARVATQPLWFFAAYAPLVALGSPISRLSTRSQVRLLGMCVAVVVVCDVIRFGTKGPEWIGWVGFLPTYATFWIAGMVWRRKSLQPEFSERLPGLVIFAVTVVVAFVLTIRMGYSWALIDAVPGKRSNTTPPTVFTVTAGLMQTGVVLIFATTLDGFARRRERVFARLREVSVGVYVWHLSAMMVVSATVALGVPLATRFTPWWWLARPVWYGLIGVVTALLVALTRVIIARLTGGSRASSPAPQSVTSGVFGVVLLAGAAAHIGLKGPRTSPAAVGLVAALAVSWWALARSGRS
jgi:hypothetical protein